MPKCGATVRSDSSAWLCSERRVHRASHRHCTARHEPRGHCVKHGLRSQGYQVTCGGLPLGFRTPSGQERYNEVRIGRGRLSRKGGHPVNFVAGVRTPSPYALKGRHAHTFLMATGRSGRRVTIKWREIHPSGCWNLHERPRRWRMAVYGDDRHPGIRVAALRLQILGGGRKQRLALCNKAHKTKRRSRHQLLWNRLSRKSYPQTR